MALYPSFCSNKKQFAVLIDPDEYPADELIELAAMSNKATVSYFFVGGSLITADRLGSTIRILKDHSGIPVIIFPGDITQVDPGADAILLLSLISGRNPELLIGKHVVAAPQLRKSGLEILPTGYMLIESGKSTTASYMSYSLPIPCDKPDIAVCTAMAGEMLGMKLIYLDGGSGAETPVSEKMIRRVRENVSIPLIVGGGIRSARQAADHFRAGADVIVIGNAIQTERSLLNSVAEVALSF